jgi:hypothetical protein
MRAATDLLFLQRSGHALFGIPMTLPAPLIDGKYFGKYQRRSVGVISMGAANQCTDFKPNSLHKPKSGRRETKYGSGRGIGFADLIDEIDLRTREIAAWFILVRPEMKEILHATCRRVYVFLDYGFRSGAGQRCQGIREV